MAKSTTRSTSAEAEEAVPLQRKGTKDVLSEQEAADLIMVAPSQVRRLAARGYIKRAGRGRYRLDAVAKGYLRWLTQERRSGERIAAENRVRDARARDFEIRNEIRANGLGEIAELDAVLDEIVGDLRSGFVGHSATITEDPELRRKIDEGVDGIFERMARLKKQRLAELRGTGKAPFDDDADEA